jgi:CBS domain-containing protein
MRWPVVTAREDTPLSELARLMREHGVGSVPILFGEWLQDASFEELSAKAAALPASEVMSAPVVTASADDELTTVVELMLRHDVNRIPILDADGELVGMVARFDLLRLLAGAPEGGS